MLIGWWHLNWAANNTMIHHKFHFGCIKIFCFYFFLFLFIFVHDPKPSDSNSFIRQTIINTHENEKCQKEVITKRFYLFTFFKCNKNGMKSRPCWFHICRYSNLNRFVMFRRETKVLNWKILFFSLSMEHYGCFILSVSFFLLYLCIYILDAWHFSFRRLFSSAHDIIILGNACNEYVFVNDMTDCNLLSMLLFQSSLKIHGHKKSDEMISTVTRNLSINYAINFRVGFNPFHKCFVHRFENNKKRNHTNEDEEINNNI